MAKSGISRVFRKIDVDQFSEDVYQDETTDDSEQGVDENTVNDFLNKKQNSDALKYALDNAPLRSKNQNVKEKARSLMLRIMLSFKSSEIDGQLKQLSNQQLDTLMKYIYKGFETPTENSSASLLTWHEKVYNIGGSGCIVRVLADRKGV